MLGKEAIERRFGSGPIYPSPTPMIHHGIAKIFVEIAMSLDVLLPDGREKSLAFAELEAAEMWANKSATSLLE